MELLAAGTAPARLLLHARIVLTADQGPGGPGRVDERRAIALTCREPPAGLPRWALHLLADKVVELALAEDISYQTVRRVLKETNSSRG